MTSSVQFVGAAVEAELSRDARILAEALMRIHGPITVAPEKSGQHTAPTVPLQEQDTLALYGLGWCGAHFPMSPGKLIA